MKLPWQAQAEQARLTRAYQLVFAGAEGRLVLADLARQCRATSSPVEETGPIDPCRLAFECGKHWVWLWMQKHLALDQNEIANALRDMRPQIRAEIQQQAELARSDR